MAAGNALTSTGRRASNGPGGIATHPLTVFGSTLCENPHYVTTKEYLAELDTVGGRPWWEGVRVGPLDRGAARSVTEKKGAAAGRD